MRKCSSCDLEVRKGALRWSCSRCDYTLCCGCAEAAAASRVASGMAAEEPRPAARTPGPGAGVTAAPVVEANPSRAGAQPRLSTKATPVYQVGDAVEVYSVSQGRWLAAKVTEVKPDSAVVVTYTAPNGTAVMKTLPAGHEQLRRPPGAESAGMPGQPGVAAVPRGAGPAEATAAPRRASFLREAKQQGLRQELFLGDRPPEHLRADTVQRLKRLIRHGDLHGARRALAVARRLQATDEELAGPEQELKVLEADGEFCLLLPRSAGG